MAPLEHSKLYFVACPVAPDCLLQRVPDDGDHPCGDQLMKWELCQGFPIRKLSNGEDNWQLNPARQRGCPKRRPTSRLA